MKSILKDTREYNKLASLDFNKIITGVIISHGIWACTFIYLNIPILVWSSIITIAIQVINFRLVKNQYFQLYFLAIFLPTITAVIIATITIGWGAGFHYYILIFPLFVSFVSKGLIKYFIIFSSTIAYIILYYLVAKNTDIVPLYVFETFHILNFIGLLVFTVFTTSLYQRTNISMLHKLQGMAMIDPLTGIYNRRTMYVFLNNAVKENRAGYVLLVDIDDFKEINDKYGHDCGDAALIFCSEIFKKMITGQGIVARWGGEEFLFLIYSDREEIAEQIAYNIKEAMEREGAFSYEKCEITLSITGGLAKIDDSSDIEETIKAADKALYIGKNSGKNQIVI
ncbi:GGDEF domain-containing protein [Salipaludibacillus neizhouensis]|nr:GGDEF domain-containing protein [Salipaludibacillus neizhouensis]